MAPNDKAGRVVFIGNIPYGITEEQIIDTLSRVGQVVNFRLVHDKESGRPKGFGFAEFTDGDSAASAVRNLNDHEIMGRKLRVDWSNDNGAGDSAPTTYSAPAPQNGQPEPAPSHQSSTLPPLPPGTNPAPPLTCADAISTTLATLPPSQLLDILSQMKTLVMTEPPRAVELLNQAPQLAYALFQALLQLNLVDHNVLAQVIEPGFAEQPAAAPQQPPPQAAQPPPNYHAYPQQPAPTPPVQAPQQHQAYAQPQNGVQHLLATYPHIHSMLAAYPQETQAYYLQILALDLDTVDPNHREAVMGIRRQFRLA